LFGLAAAGLMLAMSTSRMNAPPTPMMVRDATKLALEPESAAMTPAIRNTGLHKTTVTAASTRGILSKSAPACRGARAQIR